MKLIAIAAYSGEPTSQMKKSLEIFIDELADTCGKEVILLIGGYWGFMRVLVDRAISRGITTILFPPIEAEHVLFPKDAIVLRTGLSYRLRSVIMVRSADVLVSLGGAAGTLQEIITAYTEGKPILVLGGTGLATDKIRYFSPYVDDRKLSKIEIYNDPEDLVKALCNLIKEL